jgi:DNA integrity scanning protein DisA with diadenylate cyclase activity
MLKLFVLLWTTVELLQIAVIAMLVVGYRKLQHRLDQEQRFARGAPPSVTDEGA